MLGILLGDGGRDDRLRFTGVYTLIGSVTVSKLVTVVGSLNVFDRLLPIYQFRFRIIVLNIVSTEQIRIIPWNN